MRDRLLWLRPQRQRRRFVGARAESSPAVGAAGCGSGFGNSAQVFPVLLFGVNRSAMAFRAALALFLDGDQQRFLATRSTFTRTPSQLALAQLLP
jgi:hypothetical protein